MSQKTILIVDDETEFRFSMRLVLSREGYAVLEAGNGVEAMAVLDVAAEVNQKVDLVITDIRMPFMDGLDFLDAMRDRGNEAKVMVMTGHDHGPFAARLQRCGCRTILHKPFDAGEMLGQVAKTLDMAEQIV